MLRAFGKFGSFEEYLEVTGYEVLELTIEAMQRVFIEPYFDQRSYNHEYAKIVLD